MLAESDLSFQTERNFGLRYRTVPTIHAQPTKGRPPKLRVERCLLGPRVED